MIPELTEENVNKLATTFLDTNILLRHPITLTTFIGYAFPTDEDHPEPWGKRAGQLRGRIKTWMQEREGQTSEVMSKRGRVTFTWKDPLKIAALKAKSKMQPASKDPRATKRFVLDIVAARLK